jgi:putative transposase
MRAYGSARRSIRLAASAYRHGAFFITICTHQRRHLFGHVVADNHPQVVLTPLGRIVAAEWLRSAAIRREVTPDVFIVMPNHLHGIVWLNVEGAIQQEMRSFRRSGRSLAGFVAALKGAVTREARRQDICAPPIWQRNYFDRAIRNATDLDALREYITTNPIRWLRH